MSLNRKSSGFMGSHLGLARRRSTRGGGAQQPLGICPVPESEPCGKTGGKRKAGLKIAIFTRLLSLQHFCEERVARNPTEPFRKNYIRPVGNVQNAPLLSSSRESTGNKDGAITYTS